MATPTTRSRLCVVPSWPPAPADVEALFSLSNNFATATRPPWTGIARTGVRCCPVSSRTCTRRACAASGDGPSCCRWPSCSTHSSRLSVVRRGQRRCDLRWQGRHAIARTLAEGLDDPIMLGLVAAGRATNVLIGSGAFDLARAVLDETTVSTATDEGRQVSGMLALDRSLVAAAEGRPAESGAALEYAGELAARITGDPFTTGFGTIPGFNPGSASVCAADGCGAGVRRTRRGNPGRQNREPSGASVSRIPGYVLDGLRPCADKRPSSRRRGTSAAARREAAPVVCSARPLHQGHPRGVGRALEGRCSGSRYSRYGIPRGTTPIE